MTDITLTNGRPPAGHGRRRRQDLLSNPVSPGAGSISIEMASGGRRRTSFVAGLVQVGSTPPLPPPRRERVPAGAVHRAAPLRSSVVSRWEPAFDTWRLTNDE